MTSLVSKIYVRIRDTEWNVYRRYSQFYELHQSLRKKDPIVNSFDFPPKKTMGNMGERFVEDRRRALQSYLRCIVNYLVRPFEILRVDECATLSNPGDHQCRFVHLP